ncbi:MarR family winged helix-turn-helix transcriptional regulator [Corynebacterium aquilae]|uniref:MarR family winged helix-turn-helix transcriptional regulator n=1 Tax=Corynebacterium aquilae TaxID=203263 RepID=UPI0009FBF695|nr:helix-turn-helix domain-containing protein [Corynebacterium aquilae]
MTTKWDVWKSFLTSSTKITQTLESALKSQLGLSISDYDVLATIHRAPEQQLSMNCLKATVLVTTSGLSRAVSRLEQRELLEKIPADHDKRALTLALTAEGTTTFNSARALHDRILEDTFFAALNDTELLALGQVLDQLNTYLESTTDK